MTQLEARSKSFGAALSSALKSASVRWQEPGGCAQKPRQSPDRYRALRRHEAAENLVNSAAGSLTSGPHEWPLSVGLSSLFGFAKGGVPRTIQPFAAGGIVSARPPISRLAAGSARWARQAPKPFLPLKRGPDGRLGVSRQVRAAVAARRLSSTFQTRTPAASASRRRRFRDADARDGEGQSAGCEGARPLPLWERIARPKSRRHWHGRAW